MERFAIDACSLINAAKNYSLKKSTFSPVWERVTDLISEGLLISTVEVKEELRDDDLVEWSKRNDQLFHPLTEEVQAKATDVLRDFPTMIKMKSTGNSNADPFLIATAVLEGAIVVSDERLGDETTGDYHIPNVCRRYGIECITLNDFLDRILE